MKTIVTIQWKDIDVQSFASDLQSLLSPENHTSADSADTVKFKVGVRINFMFNIKFRFTVKFYFTIKLGVMV